MKNFNLTNEQIELVISALQARMANYTGNRTSLYYTELNKLLNYLNQKSIEVNNES
jgi:hypothetical protein